MAVNFLKYFFILLINQVLITLILSDNVDKLLSVVVIYRHGDRTPINPYPNDPYRNISYWPEGYGQLTNIGKMQHYLLGKWLRARYDGFLPPEYHFNDIYVRASDVDRTLMSAESNLAGLYPPTKDQEWDPQIPWQPIPIHTIPELEDPVVATKKPCAKYAKLLDQLLKTPYFQNVTHRNHDLYAYLTKYSGTLVSDLVSLEYIYNTLFIEDLKNLTLPLWAKKVFPDKLKPWAGLSFATDCYTPALARLKSGLFFNEIITHFKNVTSGAQFRKIRVYSAHDMNIGNILNTMGAFEYHSPPYTSTILFELRENLSGSYYLNIFYKNSTEPQNVVLKGCSFDCALNEFILLLKPVTLTLPEWEHECKLNWIDFLQNHNVLFFVTFLSLISILIVFAGILLAVRCFKAFEKDNATIYMQLPNDEIA